MMGSLTMPLQDCCRLAQLLRFNRHVGRLEMYMSLKQIGMYNCLSKKHYTNQSISVNLFPMFVHIVRSHTVETMAFGSQLCYKPNKEPIAQTRSWP